MKYLIKKTLCIADSHEYDVLRGRYNACYLWEEPTDASSRLLSMIYNPTTDEDDVHYDEMIAQGYNQVYHFHWDTNKNITHVTDEKDKIVAHYDYSAFGRIVTSEGDFADSQPFRFSCEYYDKELGLLSYNYRFYNPLEGRFLSRDPLGESGGYNLYGFCNNDPINNTDHLGMKFKPTEESKGKTRRVYVSDQPNGEGNHELAKLIKLNYEEFDKWAQDIRYPTPKIWPGVICSASVPNIGYLNFVDDMGWGTGILVKTEYFTRMSEWLSEGLHVRDYSKTDEVNLSLIQEQFKSPNIYKFFLAGHGTESGAVVLTTDDFVLRGNPEQTFHPGSVSAQNYKISYLEIIACWSSNRDWGRLVSKQGEAYSWTFLYPLGIRHKHTSRITEL